MWHKTSVKFHCSAVGVGDNSFIWMIAEREKKRRELLNVWVVQKKKLWMLQQNCQSSEIQLWLLLLM